MHEKTRTEQVEDLRSRLARHLAEQCRGRAIPDFGFTVDTLVDLAVSRMVVWSCHDDVFVRHWIAAQRSRSQLRIDEVSVNRLERWRIEGDTGNIGHETGRFFTIRGVRVRHRSPAGELTWDQPIIDQPEIGILGIAARKIDGILHFCLQAKEEPGNLHGVQLSPTVQATYSNYTLVHGGAAPLFVELFLDPPKERILFAKLQTEDGGRFLFKSNRNMVVLVDDHDVGALPEGFIWLTLRQIGRLLGEDNLVNACARSVLSFLL